MLDNRKYEIKHQGATINESYGVENDKNSFLNMRNRLVKLYLDDGAGQERRITIQLNSKEVVIYIKAFNHVE